MQCTLRSSQQRPKKASPVPGALGEVYLAPLAADLLRFSPIGVDARLVKLANVLACTASMRSCAASTRALYALVHPGSVSGLDVNAR